MFVPVIQHKNTIFHVVRVVSVNTFSLLPFSRAHSLSLFGSFLLPHFFLALADVNMAKPSGSYTIPVPHYYMFSLVFRWFHYYFIYEVIEHQHIWCILGNPNGLVHATVILWGNSKTNFYAVFDNQMSSKIFSMKFKHAKCYCNDVSRSKTIPFSPYAHSVFTYPYESFRYDLFFLIQFIVIDFNYLLEEPVVY